MPLMTLQETWSADGAIDELEDMSIEYPQTGLPKENGKEGLS